MTGIAAFVTCTTPKRFVSIWARKSFVLVSSIDARSPYPALFAEALLDEIQTEGRERKYPGPVVDLVLRDGG
jgi:hypothetical protein